MDLVDTMKIRFLFFLSVGNEVKSENKAKELAVAYIFYNTGNNNSRDGVGGKW